MRRASLTNSLMAPVIGSDRPALSVRSATICMSLSAQVKEILSPKFLPRTSSLFQKCPHHRYLYVDGFQGLPISSGFIGEVKWEVGGAEISWHQGANEA